MRASMTAHWRNDDREWQLRPQDRGREIRLEHAGEEMRFDSDGAYRAQIFALGVFGARSALDVVVAAFGQDLLGFDFELVGVDDLESLDLFAALVRDRFIAGLNVVASVA